MRDLNKIEEKTTKKKTRQDYFIEFKEEGEDEDAIFEASTKKLTLPNNPNPSKHLLPDDIHFSSKQLLQYFLKPMFPVSSFFGGVLLSLSDCV